jgi:hypothetical protein
MAYPRMWVDPAEYGSYHHAEYGNWSPNTSSMPYTGIDMMHPGTETSPYPGSPAYVKSRQSQPQCTSQSSHSCDIRGAGETAKVVSMQRKRPPLLPKALPLSAALESSTESTNTAEQSRKHLDPSRSARPIPPARRGGRRGPLREEAMRRQAPKKSACMRCRKMKIKVLRPV